MARGGYRPGAGRKKKAATEKAVLTEGMVRKGGRNPTSQITERPAPPAPLRQAPGVGPDLPPDIAMAASAARKTPLDYMLDVLNDPNVSEDRRDRIAIAAAPFVHPRKQPAAEGKKEQQEAAAKKAASGKFAPPAGPRLAVDNT